MSDHFVNLNCANCGAKLDVYDDMERFACGYCGTELIVQRRGGTVALKAVAEAIKRVQIGTDKTAAELAIARYEKELTDARNKANNLNFKTGRAILVALLGITLVLAGLPAFSGAGLFPILLGGFLLWRVWVYTKESPEQRALRDQVRQLQGLIAEKKQIANG